MLFTILTQYNSLVITVEKVYKYSHIYHGGSHTFYVIYPQQQQQQRIKKAAVAAVVVVVVVVVVVTIKTKVLL